MNLPLFIARRIYPLALDEYRSEILGEERWIIQDLKKRVSLVSPSEDIFYTSSYTAREIVASGLHASLGFDFHHAVAPEDWERADEELRKTNENLRVSLLAMREKPGRKELERLQVMQTAADRLVLNSPGFAPVWQAALKESEEEFRKTYSGLMPFLKRHIPLKTSDAQLIDDSSDTTV